MFQLVPGVPFRQTELGGELLFGGVKIQQRQADLLDVVAAL
jgi:hypothetical protein